MRGESRLHWPNVNMPWLEQLSELRGLGQGEDQKWEEASVEAKCRLSQTWAAWAPGLKAALVVSLRRRLQGQQSIRALTVAQKNAWKMHFENDHMPARRDCRTCLEAAGRSKPHHRVRHPQAFTLSVDVTGPFVKLKVSIRKGVDRSTICSLGRIHSR